MPTITIGNNTSNTYSGTEDNWLQLAYLNRNYGSRANFQVQKYGIGDHDNSLIKFSGLSNITDLVTVSSASLFLYLEDSNQDNITITLKRLLRNWGEGIQNYGDANLGESSWNCYSSPSTWTTAGGISDGNDRSSTTTHSIIVTQGAGYKEFTSAQLATDIQNMINGIYSNYGWHFEHTAGSLESLAARRFTSHEGADGQRPYIEITYEIAASPIIKKFMFLKRAI